MWNFIEENSGYILHVRYILFYIINDNVWMVLNSFLITNIIDYNKISITDLKRKYYYK